MSKRIAFVIFFFTAIALRSEAQRGAVRNNLLYDAALTPNLGADLRLDSTVSLGLSLGLNPFPASDSKSRKWRHVLVSPQLRLWTDSVFSGGFVGIHGVYSHYNVANVHFPLGLYRAVRHERRQGDLVALGGSYGRSWRLSRGLRLEAEAGLAVGYQWGNRYRCGVCGQRLGRTNGLLLLPKLALNIVVDLGSGAALEPPAATGPSAPSDSTATIIAHAQYLLDSDCDDCQREALRMLGSAGGSTK